MKDFLKNACLYRQVQGRLIIFGMFFKEENPGYHMIQDLHSISGSPSPYERSCLLSSHPSWPEEIGRAHV